MASALSDCDECSPYDSKRLAEWNPYDTNKEASFFDPGWMFGLTPNGKVSEGGPFDILIGNPPYVRQEELKGITVIGSDGKPRTLKDALKGQYECYTGTADLYVYFFERSLQLLRTGGVLSFITSNKYFRAAYGERLRAYLTYATRQQVVLDFGDAPVFTSIAYPAILVTQKTKHLEMEQLPTSRGPTGVLHPGKLPPKDWQSRVLTWKPGPLLDFFPELFAMQADALPQRDLKPDGWRLESPAKLRLLERIRRSRTPLRNFVGCRVYRGITTGLNQAFVVGRTIRDRLIADDPSSEETLKPFLRGRDVKRWRCDHQDLWLIFTRRGIDINKYPAIHEYLKKFKKPLTPGIPGGRKPGSYEWYEIQDNIAYWKEFESVKILSTKVSIRPSFAIDAESCYLGNTAYFVPVNSSARYFAGVLNSRLFQSYARQIFVEKQGGWYEVQPVGLEAFPIPPVTPNQEAEMERLVARILAAKNDDPAADVTALEREIDDRAYRLYGLTKEEVKIVEEEEGK